MRPKLIARLATFLLLASLLRGGLAPARQEARPPKSSRGGLLAKTSPYQLEVFFYATGVRAFVQDAAGAPLDASKFSGNATFFYPGVTTPWFVRPLQVVPPKAGEGPASFEIAIGLSKVPSTGVKVVFEVSGLPDSAAPTTSFTVPLEWAVMPAGTTAANAASPPGRVATSPRYVYGLGYTGYGYYAYSGPETAPAPRNTASVYTYGGSTRYSNPNQGIGPADWSTGRDVPLAKPWMRPSD